MNKILTYIYNKLKSIRESEDPRYAIRESEDPRYAISARSLDRQYEVGEIVSCMITNITIYGSAGIVYDLRPLTLTPAPSNTITNPYITDNTKTDIIRQEQKNEGYQPCYNTDISCNHTGCKYRNECNFKIDKPAKKISNSIFDLQLGEGMSL